ncbi:MAG: acyl-CoA dehydrogenase family protein, partial [Gaiellaceae bacterium]
MSDTKGNDYRKNVIQPTMPLTNLQYGLLSEIMGQSFLASEACNCSAPDTGNMEVLLHFGLREQQHQYLLPLLHGKTRSTFLMTEPNVASSDATNIGTCLTKVLDTKGNVLHYVLNGTKWWSTGAMDPRCEVAIIMARMKNKDNNRNENSPLLASKSQERRKRHGMHTMIVLPMSTPGIKCVRPLTVFGYDDAPHGHAVVRLTNVIVQPNNIIKGVGHGFHIAQQRLGPGRIHHCMRSIGLASRAYSLMLDRVVLQHRYTFGKALFEHGMMQSMIAKSKADLDMARLLTLSTANAMDTMGVKEARDQIAMIKYSVPHLTMKVVDRAIQAHGGLGVCDDVPLARMWAGLRTLRIADGPDEVHLRTVALLEVKKLMLAHQ